jgi:hypothetical protein
VFESPNAATRAMWLDRTAQAGAGFVLLNATWSNIAPQAQPAGFDPTDPSDPSYNWGTLDLAVSEVVARGLTPAILVSSAPIWAEGPHRPGDDAAPPGTWMPDPGKLGQFARAIATRYGGGFDGLPRVSYWQAWAEPNLSVNLTPQFDGGAAVSPAHYRDMLNAFYAGIKSVHSDDQVLTGGPAPYGDPPGGQRMQPALFWRTLLCLDGRKLKPASCPDPARFDIAADNPINASAPTEHAKSDEDIATADLGRLKRIIATAASTGRAPAHTPLWVTEFWWKVNPPDSDGFPAAKQARWLQQALYLFWQQGVSRAVWFQIVDPPAASSPFQTGLFADANTPRPAYQAFRFPFVADRLPKRHHRGARVRIWGMAPAAGKLKVQRRRGTGWKTIDRPKAKSDRVFTDVIRLRHGARLRAKSGDETSLVWRLR